MLRKGKINFRKAKILGMYPIDLSTARPKWLLDAPALSGHLLTLCTLCSCLIIVHFHLLWSRAYCFKMRFLFNHSNQLARQFISRENTNASVGNRNSTSSKKMDVLDSYHCHDNGINCLSCSFFGLLNHA